MYLSGTWACRSPSTMVGGWRLSQMGFLFSEVLNWQLTRLSSRQSVLMDSRVVDVPLRTEQHSFKPVAGNSAAFPSCPWASAFSGPWCRRGRQVVRGGSHVCEPVGQGQSQVSSTRVGRVCDRLATTAGLPSTHRLRLRLLVLVATCHLILFPESSVVDIVCAD